MDPTSRAAALGPQDDPLFPRFMKNLLSRLLLVLVVLAVFAATVAVTVYLLRGSLFASV